MNMEDLEYLRKMAEEVEARNEYDEGQPLTKEEIEKISEALHTNVGADDTTDALYLVCDIIEDQYWQNGEDLHGLVDEVIYQGELLGANQAVETAKDFELYIAAKIIDDGRYQEFEEMMEKGFDPLRRSGRDGRVLMDEVRTLSGAEYLEEKGLIPERYFTESKPYEYPPLYRAYPEQIDFYIAHGADVNAEDEMGQTVLDQMIYASRPLESIKKVYEAGGRISDPENSMGMLLDRVTEDYDYQVENYGENSVKNALDTIAFFIEAGIVEKAPKVTIADLHLFEKYPDQMKKIFGDDIGTAFDKPKELNALSSSLSLYLVERYPDQIQKIFGDDVKEQLKEILSKREFRAQEQEEGKDPLKEKEQAMLNAVESYNEVYYPVRHLRPRRRRIGDTTQYDVKAHMDYVRSRKVQMGKTGDTETGEVREEHKAATEVQTKTAKEFMKKKRQSRE